MPELDSQLLAELVDRHGAALKLYVRQWCLNPDDVCAASADRFGWHFGGAGKPRGVVVRRGPAAGYQPGAGRSSRWQRHSRPRPSGGSQRRRDQHEAADAAAEALAELPLEDREIVIAHVWGRLTFQEIAEVVGVPLVPLSDGTKRR